MTNKHTRKTNKLPNNSLQETTIMSTGSKNNKRNKTVFAIVLAILLLSVTAFAQTYDEYTVRNDEELVTVLGLPGKYKKIVFIDNVSVKTGQIFMINPGDVVEIDLDRYNFQGNGALTFATDSSSTEVGTVTINGSTTAFNEGISLKGKITLNYEGIYSMSGTDHFGTDNGDDVTVNLEYPGSVWNGSTLPGPYVTRDSNTSRLDVRDGTIIIGEHGKATMNVSNSNTVRNSETILGAEWDGEGTLNLSGSDVDWFTSGSFYVGYGGKGTLNISDGIVIRTGSIVVGVENTNTSVGLLNIKGDGTIVYLYGREDTTSVSTSVNAPLTAKGNGTMNLTEGALLVFDAEATPLGDPSGWIPKLGLGNGDSIVDRSTVIGALATKTNETGWIVGTYEDVEHGTTHANKLTFQNGSTLEGSLKIAMGETIFTSNSVLTPGFGKYFNLHDMEVTLGEECDEHESHPYVGFGRIDIYGDFDHQKTAKTYIDFSVFGNSNYDSTERYGDNGAYGPDTLKADGITPKYPNFYNDFDGRDTITVVGDVNLAGIIEFRPQSGYYDDDIDIHFLQQNRGDVTGNYETLILYPNRWFVNSTNGEVAAQTTTGTDVANYLDTTKGDGVHLLLDRNDTPFTDTANTYNTKSVGSALQYIYNEQTNEGWLDVLDWMWLMNDKELITAMRQLGGETRASSFHMPLLSPWKFVFDRPSQNVITPLRVELPKFKMPQFKLPGLHNRHNNDWYDGDDAYRGSSRMTRQNGLWATPFYEYKHADNDGNASAFSSSRVGFMFGYDRALSHRSNLGFVFAYSHPELNQDISRVKADDFLFGLHYNTIIQNQFELQLWGSYGTQAYRLRRNIPIPGHNGRLAADYTGNTVALSSQVAMPVQWRTLVLRPLAALDLNFVQQNSATENGYEEIALHYHNANWAQLFGRVGMKSDYSYGRWDMDATLSFSYLFAGDAAPVVQNQFVTDGPAFKIKGNNLGHSFINFGLNGQRWLNERQTQRLFLQYNGTYGRNANVQTTTLGYQIVF